MQMWQYMRIVTYKQENIHETPKLWSREGTRPLDEALDAMGRAGWELCSTDIVGPDETGHYIHVLWLKAPYGNG